MFYSRYATTQARVKFEIFMWHILHVNDVTMGLSGQS